MPRYYRATTASLPIGGDPGPKVFDYSRNSERQKLEEFLESKRPPESFSRFKSWFACDTPANSARYLQAEFRLNRALIGEAKLYAIELENFSRQPMILVNAIDNSLANGAIATAEVLAAEYWKPTRDWSFWEYTSPEIRVIEKIPWPDSIKQSIALMTYQADDKKLKQLLGED